jgi:hypothetical protein
MYKEAVETLFEALFTLSLVSDKNYDQPKPGEPNWDFNTQITSAINFIATLCVKRRPLSKLLTHSHTIRCQTELHRLLTFMDLDVGQTTLHTPLAISYETTLHTPLAISYETTLNAPLEISYEPPVKQTCSNTHETTFHTPLAISYDTTLHPPLAISYDTTLHTPLAFS